MIIVVKWLDQYGLLILVGVCAIYAEPQPQKRQLVSLATLAPVVGSFLSKSLHLDKFVGSIVSGITSLFKGKSGDVTLPGSTLKLHYDIKKCHVHFGKRFILGSLAKEKCTAHVSENAITKTTSSCTSSKQAHAFKCAMAAEIKKIQVLAQQAAKQQG